MQVPVRGLHEVKLPRLARLLEGNRALSPLMRAREQEQRPATTAAAVAVEEGINGWHF